MYQECYLKFISSLTLWTFKSSHKQVGSRILGRCIQRLWRFSFQLSLSKKSLNVKRVFWSTRNGGCWGRSAHCSDCLYNFSWARLGLSALQGRVWLTLTDLSAASRPNSSQSIFYPLYFPLQPSSWRSVRLFAVRCSQEQEITSGWTKMHSTTVPYTEYTECWPCPLFWYFAQ
jgi:hypothetical protein